MRRHPHLRPLRPSEARRVLAKIARARRAHVLALRDAGADAGRLGADSDLLAAAEAACRRTPPALPRALVGPLTDLFRRSHIDTWETSDALVY